MNGRTKSDGLAGCDANVQCAIVALRQVASWLRAGRVLRPRCVIGAPVGQDRERDVDATLQWISATLRRSSLSKSPRERCRGELDLGAELVRDDVVLTAAAWTASPARAADFAALVGLRIGCATDRVRDRRACSRSPPAMARAPACSHRRCGACCRGCGPPSALASRIRSPAGVAASGFASPLLQHHRAGRGEPEVEQQARRRSSPTASAAPPASTSMARAMRTRCRRADAAGRAIRVPAECSPVRSRRDARGCLIRVRRDAAGHSSAVLAGRLGGGMLARPCGAYDGGASEVGPLHSACAGTGVG